MRRASPMSHWFLEVERRVRVAWEMGCAAVVLGVTGGGARKCLIVSRSLFLPIRLCLQRAPNRLQKGCIRLHDPRFWGRRRGCGGGHVARAAGRRVQSRAEWIRALYCCCCWCSTCWLGSIYPVLPVGKVGMARDWMRSAASSGGMPGSTSLCTVTSIFSSTLPV